MHKATVSIYERGATAYAEKRRAYRPDRAERFAASLPEQGLRLDLGSGPGHYLPHLGSPVIAADASHAMVAEARRRARVPAVVSDLERLPLRRGALAGVWASKCLQHIAAEDLPMALAGLHASVEVGGIADLTLFAGDGSKVTDEGEDDDFPGRRFTFWQPETLRRLLVGAGFEVESIEVEKPESTYPPLTVQARRARTLPDTVGQGMRLLVCGLNPSIYAADAGVGFARPGNRFWPAARAADLVSVDRDPDHALRHHGIGMTDLVKRATVAAAELTVPEYQQGLLRVEYLVRWLRPEAVCFVGLAGWRAAVDRRARAGVQEAALGGVPVYVMPSTSGLNARSSPAELTDHLRAAAAPAG
jgi:TDG/mug DNA glycosylase family protein